jgi:general nucleoside transport system permease protein
MEFFVLLLGATLRIATPILFAALGETIIERAGVLNLGIEGTMLLSAFTGFLVAHFTGSLWLGLLAAVLTSMALSVLLGFLTVTLGLNQHVSGLGLTLLTSGLALYTFRIVYGGSMTPPSLETSFPLLAVATGSWLEPLLSQYSLTYLALAFVPLLGWLLTHTRFGLRVRSVGMNPEAADVAGVNVYRVRYQALVLGGALIGLGGAFLSLAQLGAFTHGVVNGRGWVAIAIVIFGNWQPSKVFLGALLFGFVQALQLRLQAEGVPLPYEALLALPYIVTIIVLALAGRNASYPAALLKPYRREGA